MSRRDRMKRRIEEEARAHGGGCDCTTCRAAAGDDDALQKLLRELM